jgi:glycosyltransferase involved in cell wall biosynthesis
VLYFYLSRCGIPLIQYIHNFRPFSVNGYCWGNGKLLPQGLQQNFFPEILAGAWQDSIFKTAWYGFLIWLQHRLGVYKRIHGWIAISNFMKERFIEGGIEESRIQVISHSWQPQCSLADLPVAELEENEPAFLFLGRLSDEKGLRILLDAWEIFEKSSPNGHLMIAGDGPMKEEVRQRCEGMRHASYLGFQTGDAKAQLLRDCTALIVPSIWWEPSGLVLYEAYDFGKPVLAARSGGIIDHVEDGITGWLHEPGDIAMLASQMLEVGGSSDACRRRGINGRKYLLERGASVWNHEFDAFVGRIVAEEKCKNTYPLPLPPSVLSVTSVVQPSSNSKFKIQNPKSPHHPYKNL